MIFFLFDWWNQESYSWFPPGIINNHNNEHEKHHPCLLSLPQMCAALLTGFDTKFVSLERNYKRVPDVMIKHFISAHAHTHTQPAGAELIQLGCYWLYFSFESAPSVHQHQTKRNTSFILTP